jgi:hypothetical protein
MRTHLLSSLALVATLSIVGCGGSDDDPGTTTETDTGTSSGETSTTDTGSSSDDTGSSTDDTGSATDDTGTSPTDTGTSPTDSGGDTAMPAAPTFTQVWSIIEAKCRSCHSGGSPSGNLNMGSKANAYTNLVGKAAAGGLCGGKGTRVVAGNAAMSILYSKVTTPTCGGRMPQGSGPLPSAEQNRIRDWINAGAKND